MSKGILADYLKRRGSEVDNMLMAEYDYQMDLSVQRKEAEEAGREQGIQLGEQRVTRNTILKLYHKTGPYQTLRNL